MKNEKYRLLAIAPFKGFRGLLSSGDPKTERHRSGYLFCNFAGDGAFD